MRNCMVIKFSQRFAQLPCRPWSCYEGFGGPLCVASVGDKVQSMSNCHVDFGGSVADLSTGHVDFGGSLRVGPYGDEVQSVSS